MISTVVVLASLAIANIVGAALFVAILVRPVEQSEGETRWGNRAGPSRRRPAARSDPRWSRPIRSRRWSVRIGPLDARIEAEPDPATTGLRPPRAPRATAPRAQTARVGATIGILERILIVVFVLTGTEAAIGFVVAAKTLARFRLLDDRDFAEYYLLGTLGQRGRGDRHRPRRTGRAGRAAGLSRARARPPRAGPASRRVQTRAGASVASRSAAARSVSSRFGNAKRSLVRPSSGREKNDEPGTAATPGSAIRRRAKVTSSSSVRSRMSVIT